MKLIIHRGSNEIGGSCLELQSRESRILLDFGMPLVDADGQPIDSNIIRKQSQTSLIQKGLLPRIEGLYGNEKPIIDAILISHPHPDHYGLLSFVDEQIPVYMSRGCKKLIELSYFFKQTDCNLKNVRTVDTWQSFSIGNFTITPYLVDHSGFDSLAYLIEGEDKRIFYSGDFRGHGRKSIVFDNMVKDPPPNIDYLILEGSTIGREKGMLTSEQDVEKELTRLFKGKDSAYFIACSSQNIDRIVSVYRACLKTNRIFVIDPYTAFVLDSLKEFSPSIPQFGWGENIKIFFAPSGYAKKLAESEILFKYKAAKISYSEMQNRKASLVIKDSFSTREMFAKKIGMNNVSLIYSLWEGYLEGVKTFWDNHNVQIEQVHISGHAYIEELQRFAKAINPKHIIPNHTFYPERYAEYFGNNIMIINNKVPVEL